MVVEVIETLRVFYHVDVEESMDMRELARTIVPTCITVLEQTNQSAN